MHPSRTTLTDIYSLALAIIIGLSLAPILVP